MMRRGLLLAAAFVLAGVLLPGPAAAQDIRAALTEVASAWGKGDANAVAAHAAPSGVALEVDGSTAGPFPPRQAAAVLRRVFEDRETVSVEVGLSKNVGGDPERGFGELNWVVRVRGTTIPERVSVFVALVKVGDRWKVSEIRLMP